MKLLDNYIKKHNLKFKPIYHTKYANIVLKKIRPEVVLNIKWENGSPGYYLFAYLTPNHNGYLDGNYFIQSEDDAYYQYNEYFKALNSLAKQSEWKPVHFNQISLAIWEMFLYCFDGWIAERDLEELVFRTVDSSLTVKERTDAVETCLQYLEKHDSLIFEIYNTEFRKYERNYASWLVDLIDSEHL